jgi:hypothetical protein
LTSSHPARAAIRLKLSELRVRRIVQLQARTLEVL